VKNALMWLWQLPQHLLGLALIKALGAEKRVFETEDGGIEWHLFKEKSAFSRFLSGGSFGKYVLLPYEDEETVKHEHGHSRQSLYLGLLYLPVIGIYSALFCNLWDRWLHRKWSCEKHRRWYYSRWTEAWADKLGKVKRNFQ